MEGLEVSETSKNSLTEDKRIDAEFYDRYSRKLNSIICLKGYYLLDDVAISITDMGAFSLYRSEYFMEKGVPFLRVNNIKSNYVDLSDTLYIDSEYHQVLKKSQIKYKDVLLTTKAVIGVAAIAPKDLGECNMSQNLVRIKIDESAFNPYYVSTFLNSKFGLNQTNKLATGNVQQYLNFEKIRSVKICILQREFQNRIQTLVELADHKRKESQTIYFTAENLLLDALGLDADTLADLQTSQQAVNANVKSFANSFGSSGRLDSEFYQTKYERLEQHLSQFNKIKVANLVDYPTSSGATPKAGGSDYSDSDAGIPFIRAVDLQNSLVSTSNLIYLKPEVHETVLKKTKLKKGDVLISIAGTVGRCALFDHNFDANINQAVAILRFSEKELLRLYVVTFFNSKIGEMYISKYSRQGLQTNLNLSEVSELEIPVILMEEQIKIVNNLKESFLLIEKSQNLLDLAKRAVEVAIEEGEEQALALIDSWEQ